MEHKMIVVHNIREAILKAMQLDPKLTKYKLAQDLNVSTSTHISNYINGVTLRCRPEIKLAMEKKYNIRIEDV